MFLLSNLLCCPWPHQVPNFTLLHSAERGTMSHLRQLAALTIAAEVAVALTAAPAQAGQQTTTDQKRDVGANGCKPVPRLRHN